MPLNDVAVLLREKEGGPGGGGAGCMVEAMRPCDVRTQPRRDILVVFRRRTCASCYGSESFSGMEGAEYWLKEGTAIARIISPEIKELLTRLSEPEVRSVESLITGGQAARCVVSSLWR